MVINMNKIKFKFNNNIKIILKVNKNGDLKYKVIRLNNNGKKINKTTSEFINPNEAIEKLLNISKYNNENFHI